MPLFVFTVDDLSEVLLLLFLLATFVLLILFWLVLVIIFPVVVVVPPPAILPILILVQAWVVGILLHNLDLTVTCFIEFSHAFGFLRLVQHFVCWSTLCFDHF